MKIYHLQRGALCLDAALGSGPYPHYKLAHARSRARPRLTSPQRKFAGYVAACECEH